MQPRQLMVRGGSRWISWKAAVCATVVLLSGPAWSQEQIELPEPVIELEGATLTAPDHDPKPRLTAPSHELFGLRPEPSKEIFITPPNREALLAEDELLAEDGDLTHRISVAVTTNHDPTESGTWIPDGQGGHFWSLEIVAPGAENLRLHFENFDLPGDGNVVIYNPLEPEYVFGPYQGQGVLGSGEFWSHVLGGDTLVVEYHAPKAIELPHVLPKLPFTIDRVQYGYRSIEGNSDDTQSDDAETEPDLRGNCDLDSSCYSEFDLVRKATGRMFYVSGGGGFTCTGTILANESGDFAPFFVTANHCISTQPEADSLDVAWMYWTPSCNGTPPAINAVPHSLTSDLLSTQSSNDFTMLLVNGTVPRSLFWSGWTTAAPSIGDDVTGIHHPGGSWQRICFGDVSGSNSNYTIVDWSQGTAKPGSSGSGLFKNGFIGQLCCGPGTCSDQTNYWYGKWSNSYPLVQSWMTNGWSDDIYEDNDTCASALFIGTGSREATVKLNDTDYYRIVVPPYNKATLSLSFIHNNGDIDFEAYDSSSCTNPIAASTTTTDDEGMFINNNSDISVSYYIKTYLFNDTLNTYTFNYTLTPCGFDDAFENNDTCGTALLRPTGSTTNLIVDKSDDDWWEVSVPAYTRTVIGTSFTHSNADVDMQLFTQCGGTEVDGSFSTTNAESVEVVNTTGQAISAFIRVYVYPLSTGDCNGYDMTISETPCEADDGFENNDTCSTAAGIGSGNTPNLLSSLGDQDWYRIGLPAGAQLDLEARFQHSAGDIDMTLWDACGGNLSDSSTSITDNETVSHRNTSLSNVDVYSNVSLQSGNCNLYDLEADVQLNQPPAQPAAPSGPTREFDTAAFFIFTAVTTDPEGDDLTYTFLDGDGRSSTVGPIPSGEIAQTFFVYGTDGEGTYNVTVRAQDAYGAQSPVSTSTVLQIIDTNCRKGNVSVDNGGPPRNVLFVNGSPGSGPPRIRQHDDDDVLNVTLHPSPDGPSNPTYAIWMWLDRPSASSSRALPFDVGSLCMNPLLASCNDCPEYAAKNFNGFCAAVLCSTPEATGASAPGIVMTIPAGRFSAGDYLFVQGIVKDLSDTSGRRFSVTNGIEIHVVD